MVSVPSLTVVENKARICYIGGYISGAPQSSQVYDITVEASTILDKLCYVSNRSDGDTHIYIPMDLGHNNETEDFLIALFGRINQEFQTDLKTDSESLSNYLRGYSSFPDCFIAHSKHQKVEVPEEEPKGFFAKLKYRSKKREASPKKRRISHDKDDILRIDFGNKPAPYSSFFQDLGEIQAKYFSEFSEIEQVRDEIAGLESRLERAKADKPIALEQELVHKEHISTLEEHIKVAAIKLGSLESNMSDVVETTSKRVYGNSHHGGLYFYPWSKKVADKLVNLLDDKERVYRNLHSPETAKDIATGTIVKEVPVYIHDGATIEVAGDLVLGNKKEIRVEISESVVTQSNIANGN